MQISQDGNLWCQEVECAAGTFPLLFKYGDLLGDIQVLEFLRVTPGAAIYKARYNEQVVFLKVANLGDAPRDYLIREANELKLLTDKNITHPGLPTLLPHGSTETQQPYGVATVENRVRHYMLLAYKEGDFLKDVLLDHPQLWHQHVGWFILSLCQVLSKIHSIGNLHLNLHPDDIYVYYNNLKVPQPLLLDLGLTTKIGTRFLTHETELLWQFIPPTYRLPELIKPESLGEAADVYGVGSILYEMLEGHPAYERLMRQDREIHKDIELVGRPLKRKEDLPRHALPPNDQEKVETLQRIVDKSLNARISQRYPKMSELQSAIEKLYGPVKDKNDWTFEKAAYLGARATIVLGAGAIVAFTVILLVLSTLSVPGSG